MTCCDVQLCALDYVRGGLNLGQEFDFRNHTSSCSDCRQYLRALSGEEDLLQQVLSASRPSFKRARKIISAVRGETGRRYRYPAISLTKAFRFASAFAAFAVLLVLAALGIMHQVSRPAVGGEPPPHSVLPIREAVQLRVALASPSFGESQPGAALTGTNAELFEMTSPPSRMPSAPPEEEPVQKSAVDEPVDDRQVNELRRSRRATWQMA